MKKEKLNLPAKMRNSMFLFRMVILRQEIGDRMNSKLAPNRLAESCERHFFHSEFRLLTPEFWIPELLREEINHYRTGGLTC